MWLNQYICDVLVSFELRSCFKLIVKWWLLTYGFISPFRFRVTPDQMENLKEIMIFFPKLHFSFRQSFCVVKNIFKNSSRLPAGDKKVYCWILDAEYQQEMNRLLALKVDDYKALKKLNYIPNLFFYK